MNEAYIWPLVGVVLGWLLTSIAARWKVREADRRNIGKLLAKLIRIHAHVRIQVFATEVLKDNSNNWEEYEQLRKLASDKRFLEPVIEIEKLHTAVDEISGVFPVESIHLRQLIDVLTNAKNASLSASATIPDVYVSLLSIHEVGLDLSERELNKCIKQLALKHSLMTFLKVYLKMRKGSRGLALNEEFLQKLMADTRSTIRQAQQGAQADDSAA